MARDDSLAASYARDGYAVVRDFWPPDELVALSQTLDAVRAAALGHGRSYRHGNLFYRLVETAGGPHVAMAQWACWDFPALDRVRTHPRFVRLLAPLIGDDIKQIIHQVHWKAHGPGGDFAWHQDSRSRRPREAYRNLAESYVQTGLAVDPHTPTSGCLKVIPGSHRMGDLGMAAGGAVLGRAISDDDLVAVGIDPTTQVQLLMEPGDLAIWSPFLVHASGENRSDHRRRLIINGYVRAADCDRGEWAFRAGEPTPLGPEPQLVHFEELRERPQPHYP
jgi:ectoine hydroxylase-related dioxygenase (phytanoyl-CoA dioxygenase family)